MKKILYLIIAVVMIFNVFACSKKTVSTNETTTISSANKTKEVEAKLSSGKIKSLTGNGDAYGALDTWKNFEFTYYNDYNVMKSDFESGKIKCMRLPYYVSKYTTEQVKNTFVVPFYNVSVNFLMIFDESNAELYKKVNSVINELDENGTLIKLKKKYILRGVEGYNTVPSVMGEIEGAPTLKVFVSGDMPPVDLFDKNGNPTGYSTALMNIIGERLNMNIQFVTGKVEEKLEALKTKKVDVVFAAAQMDVVSESLTLVKDYPENILATDFYLVDRPAIVLKKGDTKYSKIKEGMLSLLATTQETLTNHIYSAKDSAIKIREVSFYDDLNSLVLALTSGKVDTARLPESTSKYVVNFNTDLKLSTIKSLSNNTYSMLLKAENVELATKISNVIDKLKKSGKLEKMISENISQSMDIGKTTSTILHNIDGRDTITIAITGDLPPMDYIDESGNPAGFNMILLKEIQDELNININIIQVSSSARSTALAEGKADAVFWTRSRRGTSQDNFDIPNNTIITHSYHEEPDVIIARK